MILGDLPPQESPDLTVRIIDFERAFDRSNPEFVLSENFISEGATISFCHPELLLNPPSAAGY